MAGGNWIADHVKLIDVWPKPESLANIVSQREFFIWDISFCWTLYIADTVHGTKAVALLAIGVRDVAVTHFPEGAHARAATGDEYWPSSLRLPGNYIAGTAGAGDAFCAGTLPGLHEGWETARCLLTGVCAAAASLSEPTCTAGIGPLAECLALAGRYCFQSDP
jgi:sugar/nucleoside kinase (ribokinase family)